MSLGGFWDSGGGAGARLVVDIPYNTSNAGAVSQRRLLAPSLPKCIFPSSGLSLALQTSLEGGAAAVARAGEGVQEEMLRRIAVGDFDAGGCGGLDGGGVVAGKGNGGHKEEDYESRSGSDNVEGGSGDDVDPEHPPNKKKKYHRHTPHQIQELEALFKECPHPDEKQRMELSRRLCLESRQVKFWFQNRRTQMKAQLERHQNALLRQENEKLKLENMAIRESMRNPMCPNCGAAAALGDVSMEQQQLRLENAHLRDELDGVVAMAERFLGRPIASLVAQLPPHIRDSSLELEVGGNGFASLCSVPSALPSVAPEYFSPGISSGMPLAISQPPPVRPVAPPAAGMGRSSLERTVLEQLALAAMDELVQMARMEDPLWSRDGAGKESLNADEYHRLFSQCTGPNPVGFVTEATRETGVVISNSSTLVETLMDANRWSEMFPSMIAKASTTDIVCVGDGGNRSGALQLMRAELQVLSPLVTTREVSFLRFCKQHAEGVWAVVDVSVDGVRESLAAPASCRRLPSGCLVHDMPNGYSKVTWVEHAQYDESAVHVLYRPLLRSGMALGAQRWVASLQRQCECLAILMSSTIPAREQTVMSALGRRSMVKLAQRMTDNFCSGVCASSAYRWTRLNMGGSAVGEDVRVTTRNSEADPAEPPGVVLSAATSVWVPVPPRRLFDFLRNEALRSEWDILSNGAPMQEVAHIAKGQDQGNAVSLLRASVGSANQSSMLILQETCTDPSGSLVVYAPVDVPAMRLVMNGGDSSCVALLPSGFAVVPDGPPQNGPGGNGADASDAGGSSPTGGSLLTVAFQILVNSLPAAKLTVESVETVNNLISCTIKRIKAALHCDN